MKYLEHLSIIEEELQTLLDRRAKNLAQVPKEELYGKYGKAFQALQEEIRELIYESFSTRTKGITGNLRKKESFDAFAVLLPNYAQDLIDFGVKEAINRLNISLEDGVNRGYYRFDGVPKELFDYYFEDVFLKDVIEENEVKAS